MKNIIKEIKKIFNNDSVSEKVISKKDKYEEIHVQVGSLDTALELAEKRAAMFPSDKVKMNKYLYRDKSLKGYKVIPFTDFDLNGEISRVYIYKIAGKSI